MAILFGQGTHFDVSAEQRASNQFVHLIRKIYAAARRSAALRSTDGSAPRTAVITAQQGNADRQTPIVSG